MKLKLTLASIAMLTINTGFAYTFISQNQFYVSAAAGYGGMLTYRPSSLPSTIDNSNTYNAASLNNGVAYRASIGYLWAFGHDQYGLEAGYIGYPKNTYDINNSSPRLVYKGNTTDLLIVLKHTYSNGLNAFAKVGAAYVTQKLENPVGSALIINTPNSVNVKFGTESKILPELSVGIGQDLTQHMGINLFANYIAGGSSGQNLANATSPNDANKVASVFGLFAGIYLQV